jgi:glycosyltransferase involved in cell wall biosynthesis
MATGGAVVCTDAHGNRDFCVDGENCLMPGADPAAVAAALSRLFTDPDLRERLGRSGVATAAGYGWRERIDDLERFMIAIAQPRRIEPSTDAVPGPRRR